jgi:hypothetical protein
MHYSHPDLGPVYSMRLAVTAFASAPSGVSHDYLYTGAGGFVPGEPGVIATFAHLGACWAPYYGASWTLSLGGLWINDSGTPTPLAVVPAAAPVTGSDAATYPPGTRVKRSLWLYSYGGQRWRVWLRQLPAQPVARTVLVSVDAGGLDARDRAWYSYLNGPNSAIVGRDGLRIQPGGKARAWWDSPPAPYVVSG